VVINGLAGFVQRQFDGVMLGGTGILFLGAADAFTDFSRIFGGAGLRQAGGQFRQFRRRPDQSAGHACGKRDRNSGAQILSVQTATKEAVDAITGIGGTIRRMNEIVTAIASAVEEQGAVTRSIAENIQSAAQVTDRVIGNIAAVSLSTSKTEEAAREVLDASGQLARQADTLSTKVDEFLQQIAGIMTG
jgi:ABC-type transporter Mla subunit MlaD